MFTGIVEALGRLSSLKKSSDGMVAGIDTGDLDMSDVKSGDSIAVNGVCLTVTSLSANRFQADVSSETLSRTTFGIMQVGAPVNLEKAMLVGGRFGGHIVSGHVDGLAEVVERQEGERFVEFRISAPINLMRYISVKGSICVDGTSLTVNALDRNRFSLMIVPHTLDKTIMAGYQSRQKLNLEVDLVARYIERMLQVDGDATERPAIDKNFLAKYGFIK